MRTFSLQALHDELQLITAFLGYKSFRGQVLNSTDLADIISGLRENGLLANYSHVLTGILKREVLLIFFVCVCVCVIGYVGSKSFLQQLYKLIKELKEVNGDVKFGQWVRKASL